MKYTKGFTVVELLISLVVASVLLAWGVPSLRNFVMDGRITGTANNFVASIQLTRGTAIKQQRNAQICVSSDMATCTGGTDWSVGWLVWVDNNRNATLDAGETLRVMEPLDASMTFTSPSRTSFTYDATGVINAAERLDLCDNRNNEIGRFINLSAVGRVNLQRTNRNCT